MCIQFINICQRLNKKKKKNKVSSIHDRIISGEESFEEEEKGGEGPLPRRNPVSLRSHYSNSTFCILNRLARAATAVP